MIQDVTNTYHVDFLSTIHLANPQESTVTEVRLSGSTRLSETRVVGSGAEICEHLK